MRWRSTRPSAPVHLAAAFALLAAIALATPPAAFAAEDTGVAGPSFKEGDVITFDKIDSLKDVPAGGVLGESRLLLLRGHEARDRSVLQGLRRRARVHGCHREVQGPGRRSVPTRALENYTAGQPFPIDTIDCKGDPQAGAKHHVELRLPVGRRRARTPTTTTPTGIAARSCPLYYEGTSKTVQHLAPDRAAAARDSDGDMFRGEKRKTAFGIEVDAPFDARGILVMTYRYKESDKPQAQAQERRHLGLRPDAAPRAPHLDRPAHRRRLGHGLHASTTCARSPASSRSTPGSAWARWRSSPR